MIPSILVRRAREMVLDYLRTTFNPSDDAFEERMFRYLDGPEGLFRGPYVDLRLPFRRAPEDAWFPLEYLPPFRPYAHQVESFHRLSTLGDRSGQSTLVTTGTGSGKTECFLYPILDHCYRHRGEGGIKAILLYPMNALANDQARRLARILWHDDRLKGTVSAGLYVGGNGTHGAAGPDHLVDVRGVLRSSPPDILLTNYRMLDFLLLRPEDRPLWGGNGPETLRYLVLDELHTYDGAQGTDVACLIRRLKARLSVPVGRLCCVGTSATLGAKSRDEAARALVRFAERVFGESFTPESVVTEERLGIRETLGDRVDLDRYPPRSQVGNLDPVGFDGPETWLPAQVALWLGSEVDGHDPVAVGHGLERHAFLRLLLQALDGQVRRLDEVSERLTRLDARFGAFDTASRAHSLESFLALVAYARRVAPTAAEPDRVEPFLTLQMHLWLRELRRLLVRVGPTSCGYFARADSGGAMLGGPDTLDHRSSLPADLDAELQSFNWYDQLPRQRGADVGVPCSASMVSDNRGAHWLPIGWCRECGTFGLASFIAEGARDLQTDPGEIGKAWLDRRASCRFLSFGEVDEGQVQTFLCPACLKVTDDALCLCRPGNPLPGIAVRVSLDTSEPDGGKRPRFLARCPDCGTSLALSLLGSRAPSLLSVVLSHYFSSEYNEDRKILAFTDSVQDASHGASFFGGRTYRFNLRRAIQVPLEAVDEMPLVEAADRLFEFWRDRVPEPDRVPAARLVAALMPPDLHQLQGYREFLEIEGQQPSPRLMRDLLSRLSWEVVMEYGLTVRAGRTLESTGCSTVRFDPAVLDRVAENLALDITEQGMLQGLPAEGAAATGMAADGLAVERVRAWLVGLLRRWRVQGGVYHNLIDGYFRAHGGYFHLTKQRQPLLSPFSPASILPVLMTDALPGEVDERRTIDPVVSPANRRTWYRDWVSRALGATPGGDGVNELHRLVLHRLSEAGILRSHVNGSTGVYAIRPEALVITRRVAELECPECRRRMIVPEQEAERSLGGPCHAFRCRGLMRRAPREPNAYYANLYRAGRLERIFPCEHTGLLQRAQREEIEDRFKRGTFAGGPNMIVCTPTLEMGIDVGDLSGVMLCSVPPATSNFLQRIGRAGRRTGNSVCFTMVVSRPHDLFFHAEPLEMMSGPVFPPGCFLDAPEMLRRQLAAHAMDLWARDEIVVRHLPPDTGTILGESGWAVFPGRFIEYYRVHRAAVLQSFLALFGSALSEHNRARIAEHALGEQVPEAIAGAFQALERERNELRNILQRSRRRRREIELDPETAEDAAAERNELDETIRVIRRLIEELGKKYPLNVLTDAGVIPNYAFPEPGVTLNSVIREDRRDGRPRHRVYEFIRPASSAIREFAPFNTFYADGRKVKVDEIDLGPRDMPLVEDWRFCEECNHMQRVADEQGPAASCPRCGNAGWADAGQVRSLVLFRRARSLTPQDEASSVDDLDDRDQEYYSLLDLVETKLENRCGARAIPAIPFGYELLRDQVLRQVNFGRSTDGGPPFRVAGKDQAAPGFEVCVRCGHVRDGQQLRHAVQCPSRKPGQAEKIRTVHLYREVRSEALRILLPVSDVGVEVAMASFRAALDLGFRRHFQGNPGHLVMTEQQEPAEGGGHRNFLVVFDAVPGGTGYLAELAQGDTFLRVLEGALRALLVCECRTDPVKDGCYRCLYGYHGAHRLELISSRCAEQMLTRILDARAEIGPVDTLSDVSIADRMESELETRFLQALEARVHATPQAEWERTVVQGEYRYRIRFGIGVAAGGGSTGEVAWTIRPQVSLGHTEGVYPSSRPDFLFQGHVSGASANADLEEPLTIAVFCDGLAYHVIPGAPQGRVGDDLRKRSGILRTGRHRVWSITWKDVRAFEEAGGLPEGSAFGSLDLYKVGRLLERAGVLLEDGGLRINRAAAMLGSMDMLFAYLQAPREDRWRQLVEASMAAWLAAGPHLSPAVIEGLEGLLETAPERFDAGPQAVVRAVPPENTSARSASPAPSPASFPTMSSPLAPTLSPTMARLLDSPWYRLYMRCSSAALVAGDFDQIRAWLRLFDEAPARATAGFEESWRAFLQAWNLLQFHPGLAIACSEALPDLYEFDPVTASRAADLAEATALAEVLGPEAQAQGPEEQTTSGLPGDPTVPSARAAALAEILRISTVASRPILRAVSQAGLELPELDFELPGAGGRVGPQADLAWPARRVAVLSARQAEDRPAFERGGWAVCVQPVDLSEVLTLLKDGHSC
jgi:DEAD/DEAH box helicase domain-containing protein